MLSKRPQPNRDIPDLLPLLALEEPPAKMRKQGLSRQLPPLRVSSQSLPTCISERTTVAFNSTLDPALIGEETPHFEQKQPAPVSAAQRVPQTNNFPCSLQPLQLLMNPEQPNLTTPLESQRSVLKPAVPVTNSRKSVPCTFSGPSSCFSLSPLPRMEPLTSRAGLQAVKLQDCNQQALQQFDQYQTPYQQSASNSQQAITEARKPVIYSSHSQSTVEMPTPPLQSFSSPMVFFPKPPAEATAIPRTNQICPSPSPGVLQMTEHLDQGLTRPSRTAQVPVSGDQGSKKDPDAQASMESIIETILSKQELNKASGQRRFDKFQQQLQAELYKQITVYLARIKDFTRLTSGPTSPVVSQLRLDPDLEESFSVGQKEARGQMFEYLKKLIKYGRGEVILRNSPKVQNSGLDTFLNIEDPKSYRGTNFRGVSRNGRCNWQILTMIDGEKLYLGTVDNIFKAAVLYDIVSVQTKGLKAKTNFDFTAAELVAILTMPNLMKFKEESNRLKRLQDSSK